MLSTQTDKEQLAFEAVRVRPEEVADEAAEKETLDFGTRIHAVDVRARDMLKIVAAGYWQSYGRH